MTAVGFALVCICTMFFKSEDEFYWNQAPRLKKWVEGFWTIGLLLFVAGVSVWLWRNLP